MRDDDPCLTAHLRALGEYVRDPTPRRWELVVVTAEVLALHVRFITHVNRVAERRRR